MSGSPSGRDTRVSFPLLAHLADTEWKLETNTQLFSVLSLSICLPLSLSLRNCRRVATDLSRGFVVPLREAEDRFCVRRIRFEVDRNKKGFGPDIRLSSRASRDKRAEKKKNRATSSSVRVATRIVDATANCSPTRSQGGLRFSRHPCERPFKGRLRFRERSATRLYLCSFFPPPPSLFALSCDSTAAPRARSQPLRLCGKLLSFRPRSAPRPASPRVPPRARVASSFCGGGKRKPSTWARY